LEPRERVTASRLMAIARGVADLAPILWGHHAMPPQEPCPIIALRASPPV